MAAFALNTTETTSVYSNLGCGNCSCGTGECRRLGQTLPDRWICYSSRESDAVAMPNDVRPRARLAAPRSAIPSRGAVGVPGRAEIPQATPAAPEPPEAWGASLRAWDKR